MSVTVGTAIGTVVVILLIFAVLGIGAYRAEKVVAAKAKALREAQPKTVAKTVATKVKKK